MFGISQMIRAIENGLIMNAFFICSVIVISATNTNKEIRLIRPIAAKISMFIQVIKMRPNPGPPPQFRWKSYISCVWLFHVYSVLLKYKRLGMEWNQLLD
ncbi:MAG: hypothetical protein IPG21_18905 [Saprospiraceae bacterium]|nr:hypothetical protein [Candidatus Vicinibacter affinis]